jgi:4-amino-4-deoxy-L-arabinose transferase-like glycosyltransferase
MAVRDVAAPAGRERRWLLLILGLGLLPRLAAALYMGSQVQPVSGAFDQIFYHDLALNLLAGKGYVFTVPPWPFIQPGAPTAYYSFVYPLFLAAIYSLVGPHALVARIVQTLISGLLPWLAYLLVKHILRGSQSPAGERAGTVALVAAAITAGYAYFALYSAALQTEALYLVLVALALLLTLKLAEKPTWQFWLSWAVTVTLASLLRQVFMPVAGVLFLYVVFVARRRVKVWHVALGGAVALAMILPWTARNYRVYGQFLLLNSQYGQVLWNANHPDLGVHFQGSAMFPIPADLEGANEVELTNELLKRGIQLIVAEPWRFLRLSLSRAAVLFWVWPSRWSPLISDLARALSFGICLPFMVAGLVLSAREWRRWLLLYLFIAAYVLIHVVSWAQIRYRLPVDVALIPFAAMTVVAIGRWMDRRKQRVETGAA